MLSHLLDGVLPVFAIGALGFVFGLRGVFDFNMAMAINKFVMFVAMPALGFQLLSNAPLAEFNLAMLGSYLITEIAMYGAGYAIGRYLFRADVKEAALLGLTIALVNHVLFVLPIAEILHGKDATVPIIAIITVDGILLFSGTVILMDYLATRDAPLVQTFRKIFSNPPVIAMLLGLAVNVLDVTPPQGVDVFLGLLAATASPVLLFALGVILSQPQKGERPMLPVAITATKLVIHPALAWIIFAGILGLAPEVQTPVMMVAAAPCGVMAFMLALNYGVRVDAIARAVLYSGIGSLVTVTLAAGL